VHLLAGVKSLDGVIAGGRVARKMTQGARVMSAAGDPSAFIREYKLIIPKSFETVGRKQRDGSINCHYAN
jgi:hypothetical protein